MTYSLNEIDALAKRAARGAGLSWGMSEEAGKALRWLTSFGFSGAGAFADVLDLNTRKSPAQLAPTSLDGIWRAADGVLCPLASGAAISDCAARLQGGETFTLEQVAHPLLVVPFAAWAAVRLSTPVCVAWGDRSVSTDGFSVFPNEASGQMEDGIAPKLTCKCQAPPRGLPKFPAQRGIVSSASWARLTAYAQLTYAPATEASRRLGAGAGEGDND
ncbi:DUF3726 domain-containing protein [uncultured Litoreibacter sp.]|uniref:DUF3726 domain-containing protein n=1 Tax=uncultured Litoreibacter sp. TaxID=1392394 RepID=UPI002619F0A0|nr:DUF3726 domain-containing protein [uncultured Litoreibacter sp.]